jgi:hypothetical protein
MLWPGNYTNTKNICMKPIHAIAAGLAGAVVLTLTHQALHKIFKDAPRMDKMGEEALHKIADKADVHIPKEKSYALTMAGDIVANTLYYALGAIGNPKNATVRGSLLGVVAGIGGVLLPKRLGLNNAYSNRTLTTRLMTMAIYTLGGLVNGKVLSMLGGRK